MPFSRLALTCIEEQLKGLNLFQDNMNALPLRWKLSTLNVLVKINNCCTFGRKFCLQSSSAVTGTVVPLKKPFRQALFFYHPLRECTSTERKYYSNLSPKPKSSPEDEPKQEPVPTIPSTPSSSGPTEAPPPPATKRSLPRLMNFPEIMWPSFFNSIRNWILVQFVIRSHFDRDFYIKDFVEGTKKALQVNTKTNMILN